MEVITTGGIEGKTPGEYGSLTIIRYDKDGKRIEMGTVAGLKDDEKKPSYWIDKFPCVIEVSYVSRFPDTGKLQFGSFLNVHAEKRTEDVDLFSLG